MRIVFMGTPEFAVPALEALHGAGYEIPLIVTRMDAPQKRGKKIHKPPVKIKGEELGIPVVQPESLKGNKEVVQRLKNCAPRAIVVAAYGMILPREVLEIPEIGCLNVHASLLPKYRGAAPIQRAILEGEEKTGVTIMQMDEGLDTGDMLAKAETPVDRKTAEELTKELSIIGGNLLVETLELLNRGEKLGTAQRDSEATYAPMIMKRDGAIDFSKSAEEIERQVRAMIPWPGAYTRYKGNVLKIWKADVLTGEKSRVPGTITDVSHDGITVSTSKGSLLIKDIQVPGKKRTGVADYLRGNDIELSVVLG